MSRKCSVNKEVEEYKCILEAKKDLFISLESLLSSLCCFLLKLAPFTLLFSPEACRILFGPLQKLTLTFRYMPTSTTLVISYFSKWSNNSMSYDNFVALPCFFLFFLATDLWVHLCHFLSGSVSINYPASGALLEHLYRAIVFVIRFGSKLQLL